MNSTNQEGSVWKSVYRRLIRSYNEKRRLFTNEEIQNLIKPIVDRLICVAHWKGLHISN